MEDEAFLCALEAGNLPNAAFRHADHLRATYLYLQRFGYPGGLEAVESTIRRFAAAHGAPEKFHVTLTIAWGRFVAAHCEGACAAPFEVFLDQNRELLDRALPLRFYSPERLFDEAARHCWREPDLLPLPAAAPWSPDSARRQPRPAPAPTR